MKVNFQQYLKKRKLINYSNYGLIPNYNTYVKIEDT